MKVRTMRNRSLRAGLLLMAALLLAPFPVPAQEAGGVSFADMVLKGCVPATMSGASIADYAKAAGLSPDPRFPAKVQNSAPDTVAFMAPASRSILVKRRDMECTVRTEAPLPPAMVEQIVRTLAGDGAVFKPLAPRSSRSPEGFVITVHAFTAMIRDRRYAAVLVLAPEARQGAKAVFSISPQPAPRP